MFAFYSDLAKEIGKPVVVYYGVNGHWRGLVDAMSGFGVKSIVRRAIVTDDFYYDSDEQLCAFLKTKKSLPKYSYTTLSVDTLDEEIDRESLPIDDCIKSRMISFSPDSTYQIKRHICSCEMCSVGEFIKCLVSDEKTIDETDRVDEFEEEIAREIDELDEIENMSDEKYNIIEPGSHVALFSASNSFELFIVCKITDKSIAEDDLKDFYGHVIRKGDKFLTGVYLEKKDVSKKKAGRIYYKKHKKEVYLYPEEVFSFAVSINENVRLPVSVRLD